MNNFKIKSIPDKKSFGNKKEENKKNTRKTSSFGGSKTQRRPQNFNRTRGSKYIPAIKAGAIRLIALGGFEEVGNNMYAVETKDSIYIFDMGFQFVDEGEMPGVDFLLPNIKYLEERKKKIKAVIITHGHLDHIGGIPFLIGKLGNPPIYTRELTANLIKKRMFEFKFAPKLNIKLVEPGDQMIIGDDLSFEFFHVTHSIPNSMGVIVKTEYGNLIFSGDLKLTHHNGHPAKFEEDNWGRIGEQKNLLMISDSTNCENEGWSIQEKDIEKTIEEIIRAAHGRVIIATFASQFERMFAFIRVAETLGKKIILEGRSVKNNLEIAKESGYFAPKKDTIIEASDIEKYPADRILVISTGGQGEEFAALPRMARGEHPYIKLNKRDTVVLSSSVIPGNEIAVRGLLDEMARSDAKVITYKTSLVHSTGHGNEEELAWIIRKVHPKFFVPGYGFHSMLKKHKEIAIQKGGVDENNVLVLDNGSIVEINSADDVKILPVKTLSDPILVDGNSIMYMQKAVMDDRKALASDGFMNIIVLINISKKKIQKSPDILSRGFLYLKQNQEILNAIRKIASEITEEEINSSNGGKIDVDKLKYKIGKKVERYIVKETGKSPIIIPVVLVV